MYSYGIRFHRALGATVVAFQIAASFACLAGRADLSFPSASAIDASNDCREVALIAPPTMTTNDGAGFTTPPLSANDIATLCRGAKDASPVFCYQDALNLPGSWVNGAYVPELAASDAIHLCAGATSELGPIACYQQARENSPAQLVNGSYVSSFSSSQAISACAASGTH